MAQLGLAVGLVYWTARGSDLVLVAAPLLAVSVGLTEVPGADAASAVANLGVIAAVGLRSEEHTSELQSREKLVCRPLLVENKDNEIGQQVVVHIVDDVDN